MLSKYRKHLFMMLSGLILSVPTVVRAEILVELFTSQGCSSCRIADDFLDDIDTEDVIALSFHVNYWDYLGWKDSFAREAYTERQAGYQKRHQSKQLYTPQFVIGGAISFAGDNLEAVDKAIEFVQSDFSITYSYENNQLTLDPIVAPEAYNIYLAYVLPVAEVEVTAGENEGQNLKDFNVVTELMTLGNWSGVDVFKAQIIPQKGRNLVLIVQEENWGAVKYATRLASKVP